MNIIGFAVPKIVTLLTILIPSIYVRDKIILLAVFFMKLIIDYDAARPGHRGNIYKLTKNAGFAMSELIVACVQFLPALIFLAAAILMKAWIPLIPGAVGALIYLVSVINCVKDVIADSKRRRKEDAHSDYQK